MMADVQMPQLGETVTEGTITRWFKQVGEHIDADELLYEVSTDKVDSEVPSPFAGVVAEIRVPEGDTVDVGTVLAVITDDASAASPPPAPEPVAAEPVAEPPPPPPPPPAPAPAPVPSEPVPAPPEVPEGRLLSPVVRRLISEHNLDPGAIAGTGVGGRITRADVLSAIDSGAAKADPSAAAPAAPSEPPPPAPPPPAPAPAPAAPPEPEPAPAPVASAPAPAVSAPTEAGDEFVSFNNIRRRTGEHMVHSLATSPHALTVMEVDYEGVERVRRAHRGEWRAEEGFSLTYLPFIMRAVVDALGEWPKLNAEVQGEGLFMHNDINLGVAVDLEHEGLIVPVIRGADGKRLRGLAREVNELAAKARERKLSVDDITGGTFTISNNGSFGTFSTAAIINQPQVAVLSTDGVSRRPVVVDDGHGNESIAIHSVGYLSMAWDHRAFDGGYAALFLRQVASLLEDRDWESEL